MIRKASPARSSRRRAAVIGSGFGGLSIAIRLQAAGFDTVIHEARDLPGGRAYVYKDAGYTFDAGPTVITAPHTIDELFELAGKKTADYVDLLPVRPFYRLEWADGDRFDYVPEEQELLAQIRRRNPDDVDGYLRFFEYSKKVFDAGYTDMVSEPFLRFTDMVKAAPQLAALRADRSVYDAVARFVKDEHLRQALSFHSLLIGGNPFNTSAIYTLIHYLERKWGVFFPRGGTGALVAALVRLFGELGGDLRLASPVVRIDVERERGGVTHWVETARGREPYDLVVSNADIHHTYTKLYRDVGRAAPMREYVKRLDYTMSLFVLYFGTDNVYGDLAHHTIIFGPRYRALLDEIFTGSKLPDDFSLYLHAPTVTDPSLAPPGCSSFYVLSPVPNLGRAPIDWEEVGPRYADRLLAALERQLPDLRRHVVTRRFITPLTFERELGAYQGNAFSVTPRLTQSAWFRPHTRDPFVDGLYLVGAGTHPGAGVPGVMSSAKATARVILEDFAR